MRQSLTSVLLRSQTSSADSEHDIESLIEKTEKEGEEVEAESGAGLFAFAKVWSADKEGLEDLPDDVVENSEEADSWAKALQLIATERAKEREKEVTGRGVRRKAAAVFPHVSGIGSTLGSVSDGLVAKLGPRRHADKGPEQVTQEEEVQGQVRRVRRLRFPCASVRYRHRVGCERRSNGRGYGRRPVDATTRVKSLCSSIRQTRLQA